MSRKNIGTVKTPTGSEYYATWDTRSGDVCVGSEHAGRAANEQEAWRKANYYATTCQKMR